MWLKKVLTKNREIIMYLFFGVLTTIVNGTFHFLASWGLGLASWLSAVIAWVFAVTFAFFVNKFFVFQSKEKEGKAVTQAALFFGARLASLGINAAIMLIFVDLMQFNEPMIFVIGQAVVFVLNYIASKFVIFK
ncbi:MAG: GtrA family protein [Defluviitaleaceae bacterium]|nr:GtrA family protein [Defluviitaleaceae bacterium]